ncbi:hypothetical protein GS421_16920 [Rhodococcus hoagii]|nr:hypothetical protein [Prescottella equi]
MTASFPPGGIQRGCFRQLQKRRLRRRHPHAVRQGRTEGHLRRDPRRRPGRQGHPRLLRRNPQLDPARVDEVAIAATTQTGDQGLTIGRTSAILAGLPETVPASRSIACVAGAMTAVTTTASGIGFGQYDVVIAGGVEHMGRHPMGEGADPNPRFLADRLSTRARGHGHTAENLHDRFPSITKERTDAYAVASQNKYEAAKKAGYIADTLVPSRPARHRAGAWPPRTSPRARHHARGSRETQDPVPPRGRITAGNAAGLNDGATAAILAGEDTATEMGLPIGCAWWASRSRASTRPSWASVRSRPRRSCWPGPA